MSQAADGAAKRVPYKNLGPHGGTGTRELATIVMGGRAPTRARRLPVETWIPFVLALALAVPPAIAAAPQTGTNASCAESLALYNVDGVSTGSSRVHVAPGTGYVVGATSGMSPPANVVTAIAYVDFYTEDHGWIGWNEGSATGIVPADAEYGVMCVAADPSDNGWPMVPLSTGVWTYQDGF